VPVRPHRRHREGPARDHRGHGLRLGPISARRRKRGSIYRRVMICGSPKPVMAEAGSAHPSARLATRPPLRLDRTAIWRGSAYATALEHEFVVGALVDQLRRSRTRCGRRRGMVARRWAMTRWCGPASGARGRSARSARIRRRGRRFAREEQDRASLSSAGRWRCALLAAGQHDAALADDRSVAVGKRRDKRGRGRRGRGFTSASVRWGGRRMLSVTVRQRSSACST